MRRFPFIFIFLLIATVIPMRSDATATIISQHTGIPQPYTVWHSSNFVVNDPHYFVATGTLQYIAFPASAYRTALPGTNTFQLKLYNYYFSRLLDCQTPVKTLDEWGITRTPKDPYAPMIMFGPFTGTQCDLVAAKTVGGPDAVMTWPYINGFFEGPNVGSMGNASYANFTVYGPDIPDVPPPDPCATPGACASNVLFLPGIEGSRLYEGAGCGGAAEEKLWEPLGESTVKILRGAGDAKVTKLFLDESGEILCSDIYAKAGDVIDTVRSNGIYKSFLDEMNGLEADGAINDWAPVAYDWRLSLDEVLAKGIEQGGRIYYATTTATSTPYIEQTLRSLAASSKTGKVSIVAHSNGGLIAKALLNKLGGEAAAALVDKIILVGAPQSGAPIDIGALLYGYDQGISSRGIPILHSSVAQQLAENSPMAYHLLPSQSYFDSVMDDAAHPVARFAGDAYARELADYGNAIGTVTELGSFIRASSLNSALIDYAESTHDALDVWSPPAGIEVSQVAGWGVDTVAGIDFYTLPTLSGVLAASGPVRAYRPIFAEDGDGIVPVPSALMMPEVSNVKRYWLDLHVYNKLVPVKRTHKDIFEVPSLLDFVKNIIQNSTSSPPIYISSTQPLSTSNKKLTFYLHSPLTLELTDSSGNVTGLAEDDSISQDIPGSTYGEFGDVKYITVPEGEYTLSMHGQESGTFTLDMQESAGGIVTASSTIANVPATGQTLATLTVAGGLDTVSPLTVDSDGNGEADISLTPRVGETVSYEPPAPEPEPAPIDSAQGEPEPASVAARAPSGAAQGADSSQPQAVTPAPMPTQTVADVATTIPVVASSTPVATTTVESVISAPVPILHQADPAPRVEEPIPGPEPEPLVAEADSLPDLSQTASVYNASQQPVLKKLALAVYNGLHGLWAALMKLF